MKHKLEFEEFTISVKPEHLYEDFNFIINFFISVPKINYIYSKVNQSHHFSSEISPFMYDILELNGFFIPVTVFSSIMKLNLRNCNEECYHDHYERIYHLSKELRAYNYQFIIDNAIFKKQFLKSQ